MAAFGKSLTANQCVSGTNDTTHVHTEYYSHRVSFLSSRSQISGPWWRHGCVTPGMNTVSVPLAVGLSFKDSVIFLSFGKETAAQTDKHEP
jgi:hypothetical protein